MDEADTGTWLVYTHMQACFCLSAAPFPMPALPLAVTIWLDAWMFGMVPALLHAASSTQPAVASFFLKSAEVLLHASVPALQYLTWSICACREGEQGTYTIQCLCQVGAVARLACFNVLLHTWACQCKVATC